jgi:MSHA pilin protein MshC
MIVIKMHKNENGFTILEVVAVLVIVGILVAVAVSRALNVGPELTTGADTLKMHLRYAQTSAMNFHTNPNTGLSSILPWGMSCNGTSYWLFQGTTITNYILLPEDSKYINANKTINLAAKKISVSNFTIYFDDRGIPYTAYTDATTNTPLASNLTITVSPISGGATPITITIIPLTGYVQ